MRLHRTVVSLFVCVLLLGVATVANATPPPQRGDPPPDNRGLSSAPIPPLKLVRDRDTGSIIYSELADTAQAEQTAQVVKPDGSVSATFRPAGIERNSFTMNPGSTIQAQDLLIGNSTSGGRPGEEISTAASTIITVESFEGTFPIGSWSLFGTHDWGKANCLAVDGSWSVWPAVDVANPCGGANYLDNMGAWLDFGPFDLADAESASLDFFYRSDIQNTQICDDPVAEGCDYLFWGASTDGLIFNGKFETGTHEGGPFSNGYNFASLDLSFVAGQPEVWITFAFVSNSDGITGRGPFIDLVSLRKNTDPRIILTNENFDVVEFPNSSWISFDNDGSVDGEYRWDDVLCFPRSGDWSMWPADDGANGLDPCFAGDSYANNMDSWLVHGPLDLTGASEAWVDFYFRIESEPGFDFLAWMASTNGTNFSGFDISGNLAEGPYNNGYNMMRFDLSDVPSLGDLRNQPEVYLAFRFQSDGSITDRGPFIDDVRVVIEGQGMSKTFLPLIMKNPSATTNLYITNKTGDTLTYTVKKTPEGTKSCNVGNNQQKLCATFTSGTYDWEAKAHCGSKTGTRTYPPGNDYPKAFECQ